MNRETLLPLTGALFLVLLIASFIIAGEPPDADEDVQEIVDHYVDNKTATEIGAMVGGIAAISLVFFGAYLRKLFSGALGGDSMLPGVILVGTSIIAVGGAIDGTISFALAEAADDIEPTAVQAMQALWDNDFLPIALGIVIYLLAAGLAAVRSGAIPAWLGWIAIALAVIGVTPIGFVAFMGAALWTLIVSVLLSIRGRRATA